MTPESSPPRAGAATTVTAGPPPAPAAHAAAPGAPAPTRRRLSLGRSAGAATAIVAATVLLFAVSAIVQPQSLSHSSLLGMLPFAAILAIVAVGQTLVIQQGGIDLSVPGMISLT